MKTSWLEKELEDAIVRNPSILFIDTCWPIKLLGRQVRCRTGIIDLLFSQGMHLFIVEVKAVKATEKTIGQVTRYKEAIKSAIDEALNRYSSQQQKENLVWPSKVERPEPRCIVVAPAFDQKAINAIVTMGEAIIAQRNDDGSFSLYDYEGEYTFDRDSDQALVPLLRDYVTAYITAEEKRLQRHEEWKANNGWVQMLFNPASTNEGQV